MRARIQPGVAWVRGSDRGRLLPGTQSQVRSWPPSPARTTNGPLVLSDWLGDHAVTHIAMEATGVYWKPVWRNPTTLNPMNDSC